jgi:hypothetical protein
MRTARLQEREREREREREEAQRNSVDREP